ncbi:DNA cytosine methyltransferase [Viridibacillus arvi]|uniref:DNA cytosine methyltransferase n=1 Tax=Viridibacillus arvi TaxID=263475 RepID=UPI0034CF8F67
MKLKDMIMKKVYQVSQKGKNPKPRFFLQHIICEAAGWNPGDTLYVKIDEDTKEVIVQNQPSTSENAHLVSVSYRENKKSGIKRPLVDTAGDRYNSIVDINQKVEICVYKGKVIIRPLHFKLTENATIPTQTDERIRLTSICAGAGIGTSVFANTGYFTPVMEIELEEDSAEVLKHNFPNSFLFNGDVRDCHEVMESDIVLATLPCNEYSSLSFGDEGMITHLILAASKIIESSKAKAVIFENVPQWYDSKAYQTLKELLLPMFPYWMEKNIESSDCGSLARRNRTYAIATTSRELLFSFEFPTAPKNQRTRKLRDFVDSFNEENYEWKSLERWQTSFDSREAWKDRSIDKTFVTLDAKEIQCIPKRYRSHCASNTYVLNEAKTMWRFLTESEIMKILSVPKWFEFSPYTPTTRRYEMLGQSVDGRILSAIANNLATAFIKTKRSLMNNIKQIKNVVEESITIDENGQIGLAL